MKKHLLSSLAYLLLLLSAFPSCSEQEAPNLPAPRLTIEEDANVTGRTSATISGVISRQAGTKIAECGFLYSTVSTLPVEESEVFLLSENANGTQSAQLTNLQPNTTYYYCLYASSGYMTLRSEINQFTTDADGAPTFSDITCTEVTDYTATLSCRLTDNGGHEISTIGFCYKRIGDGDYDLPTERDLVVNLSPTSTTLKATLENLVPESEYIVRAYGINRGYKGTGYSVPISFSTSEELTPILSSIESLATTDLSITVKAAVTNNKGRGIKETGFCWSAENELPTVQMTHQSCGIDNEGTFQCNIENLNPNTTYYIRAYAINDQDQVGYSEVYTFLTKGGITVTTNDATEITDVSADVSGTVTAQNYGIVRTKGILYSTNTDPIAAGNTRVEDTSNQSSYISLKLQDLGIGITYYYCAFVETSNDDIVYGEVKSFTTTITKPVLNTPAVVYIQEIEATAQARVYVLNSVELGHYGFEISTDALPDGQFGSNTRIIYGKGYSGGLFTGNITDLQPNTTYYVRAWAERGKGNQNATTIDPATADMDYYAFSETVTFTFTITKPELATPVVENIQDKTATARVSVTNSVDLGHYGYEISTESLPDGQFGSNTRIVYGEGYRGSQFTGNLTDLQPNTTYYLRAWAERGTGNENTTPIDPATADMNYYTFSEVITFTTNAEVATPTVANIRVLDVQKNYIRLEMDITGNGNYPITEAGFCCTTDPSKLPTREDNEGHNYLYPGDDTHVETTISSLNQNTTYYIRGYAYNGYEIGYTEVITVTTMDSAPDIDDNPSPGIE